MKCTNAHPQRHPSRPHLVECTGRYRLNRHHQPLTPCKPRTHRVSTSTANTEPRIDLPPIERPIRTSTDITTPSQAEQNGTNKTTKHEPRHKTVTSPTRRHKPICPPPPPRPTIASTNKTPPAPISTPQTEQHGIATEQKRQQNRHPPTQTEPIPPTTTARHKPTTQPNEQNKTVRTNRQPSHRAKPNEEIKNNNRTAALPAPPTRIRRDE